MVDCRSDPSLCVTSAYAAPGLDSLSHWYCEGSTNEGCSPHQEHPAQNYDERCPICRQDERYPAARAERFLLSLLNSKQRQSYRQRGQISFLVANQRWRLTLRSIQHVGLHGDRPRCITWAEGEGCPPAIDLLSQCYLLAQKNMEMLLKMIDSSTEIDEFARRDRELWLWINREGWAEQNDWANWYLGQTATEVRLREEGRWMVFPPEPDEDISVMAIFLDEEGQEERRLILDRAPEQIAVPELVEGASLEHGEIVPSAVLPYRTRIYQRVNTAWGSIPGIVHYRFMERR